MIKTRSGREETHNNPLSSAIEFKMLGEAIKQFAERSPLLFIVNGGNWGDGLIHHATKLYLHDLGVSFMEISVRDAVNMSKDDARELLQSETVHALYSGGGCFHGPYRMHRKTPSLIAMTDRIMVLPHSFSVPVTRLGFRETDILFCRDKEHSNIYAPDAIFCHDMALSLLSLSVSAPEQEKGYFLRTDKERAEDSKPPEGNRDISAEGKEYTPIDPFVEAISKFSEIHTDRLHVSIAAALMGRRVYLHENSYFKNRSIYESSLRDAFPLVKLVRKN